MTRDQWLQERKSGIGASECAAVLGLDKYRGPVDVYNAKIGISPEVGESDAMRWGRRLEPFVADEFQARHPEYRLVVPAPYHIVRHPNLPFLLCTPDRWLEPVNGSSPAGLQIKTAGTYAVRYWPEDNPPDAYLCQCIHEMACHPGRDLWFLAALIGGQQEREYQIKRDRVLENEIIRRLSDFWEHHVIARVPPPMDATAASERLLKHLYPEAGQFVRIADPVEESFWRELAAAKRIAATSAEKYEALANQARERIGPDKGVEWKGGRAVWSSVKAAAKVDYKGLVASLKVPPETIQQFTSVSMPSRRFVLTLNEEEEKANE